MAETSGTEDIELVTFSTNRPYEETRQLVDVDDAGTETPVNITGAVVSMMMRRTPDDGGVYLHLYGQTLAEVVDGPNGEFALYGPVEMMQDIEPGDYVRDILLDLPDGTQLYGGRGPVRIVRGITR